MYDRDASVRAQVARTLWLFGESDAAPMVEQDGTMVTMADCAFALLARLSADAMWEVRTQALRMMGSLSKVGLRPCLMVLGKETMVSITRGLAPSVVKVVDSLCPVDAAEEEEVVVEEEEEEKGLEEAESLLAVTPTLAEERSGLLGALSNALEDELCAVRGAAIDAIATICTRHPIFAHKAMPYIVDMLNDDADEIRVKTVLALSRIDDVLPLTDSQLEVCLRVLGDKNKALRSVLYGLLCTTPVPTAQGVALAVHSLRASIAKFPEDRGEVMRCLREMAAGNPASVEPHLLALLEVDEVYLTVERRALDPEYMASFCAAVGALSAMPSASVASLARSLPAHILRHYRMFRDLEPDWFAAVPALLPAASVAPVPVPLPVEAHLEALAARIAVAAQALVQASAASPAHSLPSRGALEALRLELSRCAVAGRPGVGDQVAFLEAVASLVLHLSAAALACSPEAVEFPRPTSPAGPTEVVALTYRLELAFLGHSRALRAWLASARAAALAWRACGSDASALEGLRGSLLAAAEGAEVAELDRVVAAGGRATALSLASLVRRLLARLPLFPFRTCPSMRRLSAALTLPSSSSDLPHPVSTLIGLSLSIPVVFTHLVTVQAAINLQISLPGLPSFHLPVPLFPPKSPLSPGQAAVIVPVRLPLPMIKGPAQMAFQVALAVTASDKEKFMVMIGEEATLYVLPVPHKTWLANQAKN